MPSETKYNLEQNKANAIAFYTMAYQGDPRKAVELYVGDQYIQHNPVVEDGKEGFIAYFERMAAEYPEKSIRFVRAVAQDDLVALHTHQTWPGNDQYVTMDFFRFDEQGKILEHWDAIQQVEPTKSGNTMY
jgi:predicted SnoaL-like aldol condensation-catalyzing enzyme